MTRLRLSILSVCALALTVALVGCGGGDDEVPADAIAVVGGKEITRAEYDALIGRTKTAYKNAKREFPKQGTPEFNAIKSQAVQWLVQKAQYEEKADDLEVEISQQQIDKKLAEVKQQFFQGNDKRYKDALKQQGYTEDDLKDTLRIQLIQDEIFKKVTEDVKVSDEDIQSFYDKNKTERFTTPESRDVRHILIAVCVDKASKEGGCQPNGQAKSLADRLYTQLDNGASFAALAKRHSDDPSSKDLGGKLSIVKGQTVAPFEQTAFGIGKNAISRPVKTQYGYHIIQPLTAIKKKSVQPLPKVKEQIRQEVLGTKKNEVMTEWVKDTREDFCDGDLSFQIGFKPNPDPCKEQPANTTPTPPQQ
jgi:parvulin-like peptidyl-prolyl isomerase